jgi:hypothetical protein
MNPHFWIGPVDCPACGVSRETDLAIANVTADGTTAACQCCRFLMWQGVLVDRGQDITPETVVESVRAARPCIHPLDAYREPWERRTILGLEVASVGEELNSACVKPYCRRGASHEHCDSDWNGGRR